MRLFMLPPSVLLYISLFTTPTRGSVSVDFSAYPASSRQCLGDAYTDAACSADTVAEINNCLCSNTGNFVLQAAACLGPQGDTILTEVYAILETSCTNTKTALGISQALWFSASNSTTSTETSTITTTSAGVLTTITATSTLYHISASPTATSSTDSSDSDDDDDEDDDDDITLSAKVGAISAGVAGILMCACIVALVVLIRKRKKDQILLQEAREAARNGYRDRGYDKPLLDTGAMTPGFRSPDGARHDGNIFGASVAPPTPSHTGPMSPQTWRSIGRGTQSSPSELSSDPRAYELCDNRPTQWPSPATLGLGTVGSWTPSPLSRVPSSTVMGTWGNGAGTMGGSSTPSSVSSRQITGRTARSSWAHQQPPQEELYELPGNEINSPVEADSIPIPRRPERLSMMIDQAPPEYTQGDWNDPITDKPPI